MNTRIGFKAVRREQRLKSLWAGCWHIAPVEYIPGRWVFPKIPATPLLCFDRASLARLWLDELWPVVGPIELWMVEMIPDEDYGNSVQLLLDRGADYDEVLIKAFWSYFREPREVIPAPGDWIFLAGREVLVMGAPVGTVGAKAVKLIERIGP